MTRTRSWFEFFFVLLAIIGFNLGTVSPALRGFDIIIACICLLAWAMIVLTSEDRFKIERFGITLILLRIVTPIAGFVVTLIAHSTTPEASPVIKSKSAPPTTVLRSECSSVWYGQFTSLNDTLVRATYDGRDVEIRNGIDTLDLEWLDSCAFRVSKPNSILEFYRILQINDGQVLLEKMKSDLKKQYVLQVKVR